MHRNKWTCYHDDGSHVPHSWREAAWEERPPPWRSKNKRNFEHTLYNNVPPPPPPVRMSSGVPDNSWQGKMGTTMHNVPLPPSPVRVSSGLQEDSWQDISSSSSSCTKLFVENLSASVDCKMLQDLFNCYFVVQCVHIETIDAEVACGLLEVNNRQYALEAHSQLNGTLIMDRPIHLRLDRGEFADFIRFKCASHERAATKDEKHVSDIQEDDHERPATYDEANVSDAQEEDDERPAADEANVSDTQKEDDERPARDDASVSDVQEDEDDERPAADEEPASAKKHIQSFSLHPSSLHPSPRVYVGNLDFQTSWQELKDHMRTAGDVRLCTILTDETGKSKGYAFVNYSTVEECNYAVDWLSNSCVGRSYRRIYISSVSN